MVTQQQIPQRQRTGRLRLVAAGGIATMAVFTLNVTLAVLAILVLGGTAGALALFRGKGPVGLSRFFVGALIGMTLYLILAWYGTATSPPALETSGT